MQHAQPATTSTRPAASGQETSCAAQPQALSVLSRPLVSLPTLTHLARLLHVNGAALAVHAIEACTPAGSHEGRAYAVR